MCWFVVECVHSIDMLSFDPMEKEVYLSGEFEVWHCRMSHGNIGAIFSSAVVWNVSIYSRRQNKVPIVYRLTTDL